MISDGSTDNTTDIATSAGVTVIDNIVNRGLGKTIKRGYAEAIKRVADISISYQNPISYLYNQINQTK